ncbi:MAG TPA: glycosyltransferase [Thermoanaerobaculia bacterium]
MILVVGERRDRVVPALASVLSQDVVDRLEILLFDLGEGDPPPVQGSDHPAVRVFKMPPDTLFSNAKARAIRLASAPVVVFLEEHCRTHPGWARALIEAHRGPWAGVGAEVHNGNPEVALSRTLQMLNYLWWLPPAPRAEFEMLPGHNSSFKRDLLLAYGDELEELLRAEIVLHSRLRRDGHRLLLEPAAKFSHINESSLGSAFRGRFLFNRCYGPARAKAFGWSLGRRLFYAAAMPVFPFYTVTRLLQYAVRRRPERLARVIAGAPLLFVVQLASAAGHSLGLLFGTGDAEARFSRFEMNEHRRHQEPVVKT